MSLSETRFHALADAMLQTILETVDEAIGDTADVDLIGGVLTISLEARRGQYVINKHAPNRELWLSSPVSGAWHFDYDADADAWLSTRNRGQTLSGLIGEELGIEI